MFVQIILKKLGFDVDVLQNAHTLPDRLMSFRPNLLILTEDSRRYSSHFVVNQCAAQVSDIHFILVKSQVDGVEKLSEDRRRISSPVQPIELIKAAAESCHMPSEGLIEKFKSFKGQLEVMTAQGKTLELTDTESEELLSRSEKFDSREEDYQKYLSEKKVKVKNTFASKEVIKAQKKERVETAGETAIDHDRINFAKELFKKANDKK